MTGTARRGHFGVRRFSAAIVFVFCFLFWSAALFRRYCFCFLFLVLECGAFPPLLFLFFLLLFCFGVGRFARSFFMALFAQEPRTWQTTTQNKGPEKRRTPKQKTKTKAAEKRRTPKQKQK